MRNKMFIVGGGTVEPYRNHFSVAANAYGTTARFLTLLCSDDRELSANLASVGIFEIRAYLTKMAGGDPRINTSADLLDFAQKKIVDDPTVKVVIWNPAVADFMPLQKVGDVQNGEHSDRLHSKDYSESNPLLIPFVPTPKILPIFRKNDNGRRDLFAVAFKTTTGATESDQYIAALRLLKENSCNIVFANDVVTRTNMIVTPEEAVYSVTKERHVALRALMDIVIKRCNLTYTRSTLVGGENTSWFSPEIPDNFKSVVEHCITRGAYKPFLGATAGHFATRLPDGDILTTIRKGNINDIQASGMLRISPVDKNTVKVFSSKSKPSVGGQSQRIVFTDHPGFDNIIHFHCPVKESSLVHSVLQLPYQCGSHECGQNTSDGLDPVDDGILAVNLENHGPNIVFRSDVPAGRVISFIERNFDLSSKSGGYQLT